MNPGIRSSVQKSNRSPIFQIVFGDYYNDIEMFKIADYAITSGGCFAPSLLITQLWNQIIDSYKTNSVVRYIHQDCSQKTSLKLA
ncbi:HAD hydrolase family protein [Dolichospermum sp. LEGE 00246]|uniref:HAD hydrolase family protein n=1 Tax=Dolichospermum sp. LEGE 00246 TaxID=1828605 RepID=UPI00187E7D97|nr:HAD hydrolase family protein [Dolichospermum sp. LEGE 00246]